MTGTASEAGVGDGEKALARGAWREARRIFERQLAAGETPAALEGLSWAAWWVEDVATCLDARERAYRLYRRAGDPHRAAMTALWLGDDHLMFRGERAVANGWFQRAATILETLDPCPEHGWLAVFQGYAALAEGDGDRAKELAGRAREAGRRFGVVCLEMVGVAFEGVALVDEGRVEQGMARLDEAAAAVVGGEFEQLVPAGWTCCLLLDACERVRDYDRAAQWCRKVEDFSRRMKVNFVMGTCRAHYAAVLTWRGRWTEAERELTEWSAYLDAERPSWRAAALVRLADLRRRQGRLAEAEELLERAGGEGLATLGMAELALDRGEPAVARDLLEPLLRRLPTTGRTLRAQPLELMVRVELAAGEHDRAAAHAAELSAVGAAVGTSPLAAAAKWSEALVAAAGGDWRRARDLLEDAVELLASSGSAFELARARIDLARTLVALDRGEAAVREATLALERCDELGAPAESARARELLAELGASAPATRPRRAAPALTPRQVEVLLLVSEGLTDEEIAARLVLSRHTVHRHVQNAYARLGCGSRAAAVAKAGRLGLL